MPLSPRDMQIVRYADYFQEFSTAQILALVFPEAASRTSCDRALRRLTEDGYLSRVEKRRSVGGARGGSGEYVYTLGAHGWSLCKREGRWHRRAVDYHALAIVETYVKLVTAQRSGEFILKGFTPEPECHVSVKGVELKPDIYIELERLGGRTLKAWLEIDLGTERQARITEKLERYVSAFESGQIDPYPRIIFVAQDAERARELAWLIARRPAREPKLFTSIEASSFPQGL